MGRGSRGGGGGGFRRGRQSAAVTRALDRVGGTERGGGERAAKTELRQRVQAERSVTGEPSG